VNPLATERRPQDPTPDQISEQCAGFRAKWTQARLDSNELKTDPVEINVTLEARGRKQLPEK